MLLHKTWSVRLNHTEVRGVLNLGGGSGSANNDRGHRPVVPDQPKADFGGKNAQIRQVDGFRDIDRVVIGKPDRETMPGV